MPQDDGSKTPADGRRSLTATFTAVADPTRRAILARLANGDVSVMELAAPFAKASFQQLDTLLEELKAAEVTPAKPTRPRKRP